MNSTNRSDEVEFLKPDSARICRLKGARNMSVSLRHLAVAAIAAVGFSSATSHAAIVQTVGAYHASYYENSTNATPTATSPWWYRTLDEVLRPPLLFRALHAIAGGYNSYDLYGDFTDNTDLAGNLRWNAEVSMTLQQDDPAHAMPETALVFEFSQAFVNTGTTDATVSLDWSNLRLAWNVPAGSSAEYDLYVQVQGPNGTTTPIDLLGQALTGMGSLDFPTTLEQSLSPGQALNVAAYFLMYADNDHGPVSISLQTTPVPVPAAAWLFGSGMLGLIGVARRKTRAA